MVIALLAGAAAGILSGWGVGGGSLLLVYLTAVAGLAQRTAQGINLLYFIPCAALALWGHIKNGLVEKTVLLPAIVGGCLAALPAAWLALVVDAALLRRAFGVFLLLTGLRELFRK